MASQSVCCSGCGGWWYTVTCSGTGATCCCCRVRGRANRNSADCSLTQYGCSTAVSRATAARWCPNHVCSGAVSMTTKTRCKIKGLQQWVSISLLATMLLRLHTKCDHTTPPNCQQLTGKSRTASDVLYSCDTHDDRSLTVPLHKMLSHIGSLIVTV